MLPLSTRHCSEPLCSAPCRVAPAGGSSSEPADAAPSEASHQPAAEQDPPLLHAHGVAPADIHDPPLLHAHGVAPADVQDPPLLHAHGLPAGEEQDPRCDAEAAQGPDPEPAGQADDAARGTNELPVEVTNETPSAQRIELYRSRACLFVTTRILVVDLLSARVHGNQALSYILIVHRLLACGRTKIWFPGTPCQAEFYMAARACTCRIRTAADGLVLAPCYSGLPCCSFKLK